MIRPFLGFSRLIVITVFFKSDHESYFLMIMDLS